MKHFSALLQFILGFFVGVLLLVSGTAALAYVVFYRLNTSPPKPTFAEEKQEETKKASNADSKAQETPNKTAQNSQEVVTTISESSLTTEEDLPEGAYKASVTWPSGLSLRAEPGQDAERIGGVGYKAELIILKTSSDGDWQNVRLPRSGQEGWVKAGNVEKIE